MNSIKKWEMGIKESTEFLNQIDLESFLENRNGDELYEIMEDIETKFPYLHKFGEGLFDWWDEDSFSNYVNKRFKGKFGVTEYIPEPVYTLKIMDNE